MHLYIPRYLPRIYVCIYIKQVMRRHNNGYWMTFILAGAICRYNTFTLVSWCMKCTLCMANVCSLSILPYIDTSKHIGISGAKKKYKGYFMGWSYLLYIFPQWSYIQFVKKNQLSILKIVRSANIGALVNSSISWVSHPKQLYTYVLFNTL